MMSIRAILSLMAAHDMRNIPRNLPATRPRIIARLTPLTTMPGVMSPKKIPALAKAKRGIIQSKLFYAGIGIFVWFFFLRFGIHPTTAGIGIAAPPA